MKRKLSGIIKSNLSIITKKILIIFIIFTLFFTISALALSNASSAWPMFRHDPQHTGRSPYKGAEIDMFKWKLKTGSMIFSSPAIGSDGTIYVGSSESSERASNLYAINPNGTLKWKFGAGDEVRSSPAINSDGTIYVGSRDHYLYAINPNGTLKWKFGAAGEVDSSPAISSDGTIYFRGGDYLYAINPNGTLKWKFGAAGEVDSSPAIGSDGTIYFGSEDYCFYAINPNGTLKWSLKTEYEVDSSPAIGSDGTIYVGSGHYIYAINPNGNRFTRFKTGHLIYSSPAIGSDGTIYVGESDGNLYAIGSPVSSPQISETTYSLTGSLHCPDKRGYPCDSCSSARGYVNHFQGFNVLTTNGDCYVKLIYNNGAYIGNQNNCEVTIKGEKWLGLENESGTELVEEINKGNFDFARANKFIERTMNLPGDNYKYEFANEGKEFRLYLSRNREEAFKAVPWKNITVEIKNKETDKVFKYKFQKGIFPQAYSWSNGVANYGQCVWWTAKRWVGEVDSQNLFPFYPSSPQVANVRKIESDYQPERFDILIDYIPGGQPGHYGFVEKVDEDLVHITQFNFIKPGEVYNYISRFWNGNPKTLYYSINPHNEYYFKYYYRK